MSGVLALVVLADRDYPGGRFTDHDVVDSRTGEAFASRACMESAQEIAIYLNSTYPIAELAPAYDSLVHEIRCHRISGEAPAPLNRVVAERGATFPSTVPVGAGWDHLMGEAQ